MLPAMAAGLVRVWACDPKLMELAFGRALFDRYGRYAADPADIADLLEAAVSEMQARAQRFAGRQRDHTPTPEHPFVVVLVDEIARSSPPTRPTASCGSASSRHWPP